MAVTVKFTLLGTAVDLTDVDVNPDAAPTSTPRQGGFTLRNRINFDNVSAANKLMWTVSDATPATETTVPFVVLQVPKRVFVKDLTLFCVEGQSVPTFATVGPKGSSNSSITASDLSTMTLGFGATKNRKSVANASYAAASDLLALTTVNAEMNNPDGEVAADVFGQLGLNTASVSSAVQVVFDDTFKAIDGSLASPLEPMQQAKVVRNVGAAATGASTLSQKQDGEYFPYGGNVHMKLGPWNTSLTSKISTAAGWFSTTGATTSLAGVWEIQANCMYVPE
jgi:hypothetical protein